MLNEKTLTYPHAVVKSFGYLDDFVQKTFSNMPPSEQKSLTPVSNNADLKCICCGQIYPFGLYGDVTKRIFTANFNEAYTLANPTNKNKIEFICGCCHYALKNYQDMRMQNVVVYQDGSHEHVVIRNNAENEMYDVIFNPKSLPYIMLINTRGKVLEFLVHLAIPTISKRICTVVFGTQVMYIDTVLLKECLDDALAIMTEYKVHKTTLLNAYSNDVGSMRFANGKNKTDQDEQRKKLYQFYLKYDKDTRVLADKLLEKHKLITQN